MAVYSKLFSANSSYQLELSVTQGTQSVANNTTVVSWVLTMVKLSGSGYRSGYTGNWSVTIDGTTTTGTTSGYDFRNYTRLQIASGSKTVTHNSNGTKSVATSGTLNTNASTVGSATASGTLALTAIARTPNMPSLSVSGITRTSFVVNWSTNLVGTYVGYRINGAAEVHVATNASSGSLTFSGRGEGTSTSIAVRILGPGGASWSASNTITGTTQSVSYLTGISVSPTFGTNSSVSVSFAHSVKGVAGTQVRYKTSVGSWSAWTTATTGTITGLSNGTNYSVQFEAYNNNSGVVTYYSGYGVTTHALPTGSYSVSVSGKRTITITMGATGNTTTTSATLLGGSTAGTIGFETFSGTKAYAINQNGLGTTATVGVSLYSSTTGLTTRLGNQALTIARDSFPNSLVAAGRTRSTLTFNVGFSDGLSKYRWRISNAGSTTWTEVSTTSKTATITTNWGGALTSNATFTLEIQAVDSVSGAWGSVGSVDGTTAAFRPPTVTLSSDLTRITAVYKIVDSCYFKSSSEGAEDNTLVEDNGTITKVFEWDSTKNPRVRFSANTSYTLSGVFKDQYSATEATISGVSTTANIPSITSFAASPSTLSSFTTARPTISLALNSSLYSKSITYRFKGSTDSSRSITKTVAAGVSGDSHAMTQADVEEIVAATTSSITAQVEITIKYTHNSIESPTTTVRDLNLTLLGSLINVKPATSVIYSKWREGTEDQLNLNALVSNKINEIIITTPTQDVPRGSTIVKNVIRFQGEEYPLIEGEATIGGVQTFTNGTSFTLELTDGRGLKNSVPVSVSTYEYSTPQISMDQIVRKGGFGEDLEMDNANIQWSSPPTTDGIKNQIKGVQLTVLEGGSLTPYAYGNIIPASSLTTTTHGSVSKFFGKTDIVSKSETTIGKIFASNKVYNLNLVIVDKFGESGGILDYRIGSGESILFLDSKNKQVGINTTEPTTTLDVNGDAKANNLFALNSLFFKIEDIEDV